MNSSNVKTYEEYICFIQPSNFCGWYPYIIRRTKQLQCFTWQWLQCFIHKHILVLGDFRAVSSMGEYQHLQNVSINTIYLDTTYVPFIFQLPLPLYVQKIYLSNGSHGAVDIIFNRNFGMKSLQITAVLFII